MFVRMRDLFRGNVWCMVIDSFNEHFSPAGCALWCLKSLKKIEIYFHLTSATKVTWNIAI
jgi:hypothetical protein